MVVTNALRVFFLFILMFAYKEVTAGGNDADEWSYKDQDKWPKLAQLCAGDRQSPINIDTSSLVLNESLKLEFQNYAINFTGNNSVFVNDGHSAKLLPNFKSSSKYMTVNISSIPTMSFALLQLHFHWSDAPNTGTEHSINGKKYAAECHFVHQNTRYHSLSEATEHKDGLLVLGVMFEVGSERNTAFDPLFKALPKIEKYSTDTTLEEDFSVLDLLPKNLDSFYTYDGSLTTPPCSEAVTWILFKEKSTLSEDQINELRRLTYLDHGTSKFITDNVRHLQSINKRRVQTTDNNNNAGFTSQPTITLLLFVFLSTVFASRCNLCDYQSSE